MAKTSLKSKNRLAIAPNMLVRNLAIMVAKKIAYLLCATKPASTIQNVATDVQFDSEVTMNYGKVSIPGFVTHSIDVFVFATFSLFKRLKTRAWHVYLENWPSTVHSITPR
jgi:hypothetical protein